MSNQQNQTEIDEMLEKSEMPSEEEVTEEASATEKEEPIPEEEKGNAFAEGMQLIYKQLQTELENLGVTPIEAVGKEFDPNFHNAVMQMESEEYESGYVVQEMLKGYMYRDTVVRHSMVAVVP